MDVLKISDHIVGRLCGEIERHRAGESASVKIRGRIGELPAAAFDDGIGAKAAKLKRRKREFSDRKNAAGAQPRRHLPRLRRGSEEREEALKSSAERANFHSPVAADFCSEPLQSEAKAFAEMRRIL